MASRLIGMNDTERNRTIIPVGDSYTARTSSINSTVSLYPNHAHFNWFQIYNGFQFDLLNNAGVDGQRTDQILARLSADVFAYNPAWVLDVSGLNDIIQNVTSAVIIGYKTQMVEAYLRNNVRPIICTIPPSDANNTTVEAARSTQRNVVNRWIRSLPKIYPGVIVADIERVMVDPTSVNGYAKANILANAASAFDKGVHLTTLGAQRVGKAIWDALSPYLPTFDDGVLSAGDCYALSANSKNIVTEPLFLNGGGTTTTGGSGTVVNGAVLGATAGTPTAVGSLVDRADGFGKDQLLEVMAGAEGDTIRLRQTGLSGRASVGDILSAACSVELIEASAVRAVWLQLEGQTSATYRESRIGLAQSGLDAAYFKNLDNFAGRLKTALVPLSDGASIASVAWSVHVVFNGAGSAKIKIGRMGLVKA